MDNQLTQLKNEIAELRAEVNALKSDTTIPLPVDKAFRSRLGLKSFVTFATTSKTASSENQNVNEAGFATYSVLKPPDGFLQTSFNGSTFYLAYWT